MRLAIGLSCLSLAWSLSWAGVESIPIPRQYFGTHIHRILPNKLWEEVGFGAVRLHDANVTWLDLEPEQGKWNWDKLDQIVRRLATAQVEVLLPLQATPSWASSDSGRSGAYGPGANVLPRRLEDWDNYVTQVVRRYKGRIGAYEIWNEPNLKQFYDGTPESMATLTERTSKLVRSIDPSAKLVCSSVTGSYGIEYFRRYLKAGAGAYCDVLGYHLYTGHKAPEAMLPILASVAAVAADNGQAGKPIWNTETGWVIDQPGGVDVRSSGFKSDVPVLDDDTASAYLVRGYMLGRSAGLERFYWYSWDHPSMGVAERRGVAWRRSARVYASLIKWLSGATVSGCSVDGRVWRCNVAMRDGRLAAAVWAGDGDAAVDSPVSGELWTFDSQGELTIAQKVRAGQPLRAGPMPVLLIGK